MTRRWCTAGILVLAALVLGAPAADDSAPDPLDAVKEATRKLSARARAGYAARCEVQGGLSKSADHELDVVTTVNERYEGLIRGAVMHVPAMQVFRTPEKGALRYGDRWYSLVAIVSGKKLDRLFTFPVPLLTRAIAKPEKIEWLPSTERPAGAEGSGGSDGGATGVAEELTREQLYHRVRIQAPDEEALRVFSEMQNSGCLPGN